MTKKKLFVIFSSETTLILIHLSHGTKFDPKSPKFKVSHLARGGGLTPNETLSHSNGKFVFDHGPYRNLPLLIAPSMVLPSLLINIEVSIESNQKEHRRLLDIFLLGLFKNSNKSDLCFHINSGS